MKVLPTLSFPALLTLGGAALRPTGVIIIDIAGA